VRHLKLPRQVSGLQVASSRKKHLTPSKLEGIDRPPRLIVANACLSAAISQKTSDGRGAAGASGSGPLAAGEDSKRRPVGDSRLVASLADEFFKRGVADYIGTAWEVPDGPAQLFAKTFWDALLQGYDPTHKGADAPRLGTALQEARRALYARRLDWREFATVWAAYQHYGDPTRGLWE
jgi:CHAT domain-containing protein